LYAIDRGSGLILGARRPHGSFPLIHLAELINPAFPFCWLGFLFHVWHALLRRLLLAHNFFFTGRLGWPLAAFFLSRAQHSLEWHLHYFRFFYQFPFLNFLLKILF
jgi:hypothetical protein